MNVYECTHPHKYRRNKSTSCKVVTLYRHNFFNADDGTYFDYSEKRSLAFNGDIWRNVNLDNIRKVSHLHYHYMYIITSP